MVGIGWIESRDDGGLGGSESRGASRAASLQGRSHVVRHALRLCRAGVTWCVARCVSAGPESRGASRAASLHQERRWGASAPPPPWIMSHVCQESTRKFSMQHVRANVRSHIFTSRSTVPRVPFPWLFQAKTGQ